MLKENTKHSLTKFMILKYLVLRLVSGLCSDKMFLHSLVS
jgi:hypothetical protein